MEPVTDARRSLQAGGLRAISRWSSPPRRTTPPVEAMVVVGDPGGITAIRCVSCWHPCRGAMVFAIVDRWCRCAQPPANGCEPFGFSPARDGRQVVGRCHSAESRQGRKTETRIVVPINHSFAPAGAMESCSRLEPSDESLGYFRNVPVGTKARITNARVRGSQSAAGGRPGAAEPFPRLKLPTKRAEPAVVSKDALI